MRHRHHQRKSFTEKLLFLSNRADLARIPDLPWSCRTPVRTPFETKSVKNTVSYPLSESRPRSLSLPVIVTFNCSSAAIQVVVTEPTDPSFRNSPPRGRRGGLRRDVAERVHLLGALGDVTPVHEAIDVLLAASFSEGLPVAMIEAAAAARPVVSTAVGGVPELVRNGVTGLFGTDRDGLATAIR